MFTKPHLLTAIALTLFVSLVAAQRYAQTILEVRPCEGLDWPHLVEPLANLNVAMDFGLHAIETWQSYDTEELVLARVDFSVQAGIVRHHFLNLFGEGKMLCRESLDLLDAFTTWTTKVEVLLYADTLIWVEADGERLDRALDAVKAMVDTP